MFQGFLYIIYLYMTSFCQEKANKKQESQYFFHFNLIRNNVASIKEFPLA